MKYPKKGKYRHYKGGEYELLYIATHSETLEKMVVYRKLYAEKDVWVRPLGMFMENVESGGGTTRRFTYTGD
jgi:cyclomaltodextrinase